MIADHLRECTDDELVGFMFSDMPALAMLAKRIFDERHASDPPLSEPPHCPECFEGCAKCQPKAMR